METFHYLMKEEKYFAKSVLALYYYMKKRKHRRLEILTNNYGTTMSISTGMHFEVLIKISSAIDIVMS